MENERYPYRNHGSGKNTHALPPLSEPKARPHQFGRNRHCAGLPEKEQGYLNKEGSHFNKNGTRFSKEESGFSKEGLNIFSAVGFRASTPLK